MPDDAGDGLLKKIEALLSRIPKAADDEPAAGKTVSYDRFFHANQRAKAAEEGLAALQAEVKAFRESQAGELKKVKDAGASDVAQLALRHHEDLALVDMGFDADGRSALRAAWDRQPEATRPKTPSEMWKGHLAALEAHRKDPEKAAAPEVPKTLAAYLPAAKEDVGAEPAAKPATRVGGVRLGVDRDVVKGEKKPKVEKIGQAKSWAELEAAVEGS